MFNEYYIYTKKKKINFAKLYKICKFVIFDFFSSNYTMTIQWYNEETGHHTKLEKHRMTKCSHRI